MSTPLSAPLAVNVDTTLATQDSIKNAAKAKDSPEKIHDAAVQFEGLLIGQILKSAKSDDQGLFGQEDDNSAQTASDFATDYLARALASSGGLGLANMISKNLSAATQSNSSNHGTQAPVPDTPSVDKLAHGH